MHQNQGVTCFIPVLIGQWKENKPLKGKASDATNDPRKSFNDSRGISFTFRVDRNGCTLQLHPPGYTVLKGLITSTNSAKSKPSPTNVELRPNKSLHQHELFQEANLTHICYRKH